MNERQALKILGLKAGFTDSELKKAYRNLAKQHHPDKNKGDRSSEEKFKEISDAYEFLKNPSKFSNSGHSGFNSRSFGPDDLEEMLRRQFNRSFTSRPKKPKPGSFKIKIPDPSVLRITVLLEEVLLRKEIHLSYKIKSVCKSCLGSGSWKECASCSATGSVLQEIPTPMGMFGHEKKCFNCKGVGWKPAHNHCQTCKDNLIYDDQRDVSFKVPKGYKLGQKVTLNGKGSVNWKCPNGNITVYPAVSIPDLSKLSEKDVKILEDILKKGEYYQ